MRKKKDEPVEERRAPDPEGAIEVAFVEGVLPEEDRRSPEAKAIEAFNDQIVDALLVDPPPPVIPGFTQSVIRSREDDRLHVKRAGE